MALELGPLAFPKVLTTLTNFLLYCCLRAALPVFFFFFSPASTFGVCPFTLPARASEPWTFPPCNSTTTSSVDNSHTPASARVDSPLRSWPANDKLADSFKATFCFNELTFSSAETSTAATSWFLTKIFILLTLANVLGEKGRRIRELTSVVQKRFNFPEGTVELYAEKVA